MSVVIIRCQRLYFRAPWTDGIAVDHVNRGRTTSRRAWASRCHHCSASQKTGIYMRDHITADVSFGSTLNDAWASRVLIDCLIDITSYYASSQKFYVRFLSRLNITISLVRALCLKFGIFDRCWLILSDPIFSKKATHDRCSSWLF